MRAAESVPSPAAKSFTSSMSDRHYFALLLVVIVPLFACGITNHGLWGSDEPRVAEIGRGMTLTGNWTVPTFQEKRSE